MQNGQDLEPLLSVEQNQLNLIIDASDGIDSKGLAILAIIVALLIFIAQAGLNAPMWKIVLLDSAYALALICNGFAVWPRKYLGSSALSDHPEYLSLEKQDLMLQLISDTLYAREHNVRLNAIRWRFCVGSLVLTTIGTGLLLAIL